MSPRQWDAQQAYLRTLRVEAEKRAQSARLWDTAEQVFVARIETVVPRKIKEFWGSIVDIQDVELRPFRWLKGTGADQSFTLGVKDWSDCGPDPRWDALWGDPGQEFVVYVASGVPSQTSVMEAIAPENLLDPRVKTALGLNE